MRHIPASDISHEKNVPARKLKRVPKAAVFDLPPDPVLVCAGPVVVPGFVVLITAEAIHYACSFDLNQIIYEAWQRENSLCRA